MIAHLARASGAAPLSALAALWGRDLSTLSRVARRIEDRRRREPAFARRLEEINNTITQA